ncbi:CAP domain-containing protein [uncultured Phyllobacterium sp.]|uniref:CAP domain-containing protein n=1 Tax=uncultured Phyllobacterium sp. TaxID=253813 RepID=UPI0025873950|nr:CAP domain-containing protein [uncultured Phyllobacterium sp.]
MPNHRFHLSRRSVLGFAAVSALLPLAACQTVTRTPGKSAGVSASATSLVQNIRSSNGLAGLAADSSLESAALQQAGYMASAGRMSHTTGWGRDFATRVRNNEIHGIAAENIAVGRMELDRLFAMWMASPPHRRNMLDQKFTRFGLAYSEAASGSSQRYWALVLAS